jgi:hypothetical protein
MVSRLVFFFFSFIPCFLSAEPNSAIKAGVAVPKRAPLDAAPENKSPAHGGRNPTYGVEDGEQRQFSSNEPGCTLRYGHSSLTPFRCVVTISAQFLT